MAKAMKMFYLPEETIKKLKVLAFVTDQKQSTIATLALEAYLSDMENALSEDSETADKIQCLLRNADNDK